MKFKLKMNKYFVGGAVVGAGVYFAAEYAMAYNPYVFVLATTPLWEIVVGGIMIAASKKQNIKDAGKGLIIGTAISFAVDLTRALLMIQPIFNVRVR